MTTNTELIELRRLAEAATQAPWEPNKHGAVIGGVMRKYVRGTGKDQLFMACVVGEDNSGDQLSNTAYIAAANPTKVIELLETIEAQAKQIEELQADAAQDPIRALITQHAEILNQNESAYFELAHHKSTGWMAFITDKPLCMPPVINPDRTVLAQGQGETAEEACSDAARKEGGEA